MNTWLNSRTVRLPFAIALLASTGFLILDALDLGVFKSIATLIGQLPLKDILVNAVGGFLGGLTLLWVAVGTRGIHSLRTKLTRPSVRLLRGQAPENIFTGLELGAPAKWIQQC